jgi:hypothetical protein
MSSEQIKSLIRHILTGLGILFTVIGLDKWIPMVQYIQDNLETTSIAIMTLVGLISTIVGFFKDKKRWEKSEDQKNTQ